MKRAAKEILEVTSGRNKREGSPKSKVNPKRNLIVAGETIHVQRPSRQSVGRITHNGTDNLIVLVVICMHYE